MYTIGSVGSGLAGSPPLIARVLGRGAEVSWAPSLGGGAGGLDEEDVEADGCGPTPAEEIQQAAVERPGPRPRQVELVEGILVDGDDDNGRGGANRPPEEKPPVKALELHELDDSQEGNERDDHPYPGPDEPRPPRPGEKFHAGRVAQVGGGWHLPDATDSAA